MQRRRGNSVRMRLLRTGLLCSQKGLRLYGAGAKAFLTEVSSRVKQVTGNGQAVEFLRQRVDIEIQQRNAAAVMGTVDSRKERSNLFLLS